MNVKLSISGVEEIDRVLRGLPLQVSHKILGQAHAEAAKPIIPAAQSKIKDKTGNLRASIGTEKIALKKATAVGMVYVGPRRKRGYKGKHGHLIEFGHRIRRRKGGPILGFVKPYPFMEPAFISTKSEVIDNIKDSVGRKLRNFMRTTIRRSGGTWSK
jgi:hypothetical protein